MAPSAAPSVERLLAPSRERLMAPLALLAPLEERRMGPSRAERPMAAACRLPLLSTSEERLQAPSREPLSPSPAPDAFFQRERPAEPLEHPYQRVREAEALDKSMVAVVAPAEF